MIRLRLWCYTGTYNFGDQLTLLILAHYGKPYGIEFVMTKDQRDADVIGIGSLLQGMDPAFRGTLWSTGSLGTTGKPYPREATVLLARGPLTREAHGLPPTCPQGDGGLLLGRMFARADTPRYSVGVIPHYVDHALAVAHIVREEGVVLIDVTRPVAEVVALIQQCGCILSSSLHGLIAADALGIPNRQLRFGTSKRIKGGAFKFRDYYASLGLPLPRAIQVTARFSALAQRKFVKRHCARGMVPALQQTIEAVTHEMMAKFANHSQIKQ